ncbi:MAG: hypothetical protein U5J63_14090 [Fodinibius sp.]|nr:hypothetical protein [Fodinibius sp.]
MDLPINPRRYIIHDTGMVERPEKLVDLFLNVQRIICYEPHYLPNATIKNHAHYSTTLAYIPYGHHTFYADGSAARISPTAGPTIPKNRYPFAAGAGKLDQVEQAV